MSIARDPGGERYRLELEALADDVPAAVRLRRALKCLLRAFGLRCRSAANVTPREPSAGAEPAAGLSERIDPP
jgi:hypothetical protein